MHRTRNDDRDYRERVRDMYLGTSQTRERLGTNRATPAYRAELTPCVVDYAEPIAPRLFRLTLQGVRVIARRDERNHTIDHRATAPAERVAVRAVTCPLHGVAEYAISPQWAVPGSRQRNDQRAAVIKSSHARGFRIPAPEENQFI